MYGRFIPGTEYIGVSQVCKVIDVPVGQEINVYVCL